MEKTQTNATFTQSIKSGLLSFILSTAFVLLLALIAKTFTLPADVLPIVNQVLKAVAVCLGTLFSIKEDKLLPKAILGALLFSLLNLILFFVLGGEFGFWQFAADLGIALAVAAVAAVIKSRKK